MTNTLAAFLRTLNSPKEMTTQWVTQSRNVGGDTISVFDSTKLGSKIKPNQTLHSYITVDRLKDAIDPQLCVFPMLQLIVAKMYPVVWYGVDKSNYQIRNLA